MAVKPVAHCTGLYWICGGEVIQSTWLLPLPLLTQPPLPRGPTSTLGSSPSYFATNTATGRSSPTPRPNATGGSSPLLPHPIIA